MYAHLRAYLYLTHILYANTSIFTHTLTNTHTQAHTHKPTQAHTHTPQHTHKHTHTNTHTHTCTQLNFLGPFPPYHNSRNMLPNQVTVDLNYVFRFSNYCACQYLPKMNTRNDVNYTMLVWCLNSTASSLFCRQGGRRCFLVAWLRVDTEKPCRRHHHGRWAGKPDEPHAVWGGRSHSCGWPSTGEYPNCDLYVRIYTQFRYVRMTFMYYTIRSQS